MTKKQVDFHKKDPQYQNRFNFIRGTAWSWIREKRPDVAEQIMKEADQLYPRPIRDRRHFRLSDSLKNTE